MKFSIVQFVLSTSVAACASADSASSGTTSNHGVAAVNSNININSNHYRHTRNLQEVINCNDLAEWYVVQSNGNIKDCAWVANKPENRCGKNGSIEPQVDGAYVSRMHAYNGCPEACIADYRVNSGCVPTMSPTASLAPSVSALPTKTPTAVPSFSPTSSYQPSEVPTYRPSRSPTIKNSHYFTACGSSAQWCSGLVDSSANEELHAVRCCADSKINDAWIRHSNCAAAGLDVWSKSEINGVCHSFKTFVEAENVCHQIKGARLCTREELEADCSRNSGCSFDGKVVWSSTAADPPPTLSPTKNPTMSPSITPTSSPSKSPSISPSASPSHSPSVSPSANPTSQPTKAPSKSPSASPSASPTAQPSESASPTISVMPTEVPTYRPSRSPTVKNSHYWSVCGSTKCSLEPVSSAIDEEYKVRCCADTYIGVGWKQHSNCINAGFEVWGDSEINGVCISKKTYVEAENACHQMKGARLCTKEEVEADCARGTGCGYDSKMVWTSTASSAPPTSAPTANPTQSPSTASPSHSPSVSPTANPSTQPTQSPSYSPSVSPTANPTTQPSRSPSESPTRSPSAEPTRAPWSDEIFCPPEGVEAPVSPGLKFIPVADANTYCGIFLRKGSGDIIPLARSYNGQGWESAPGPFACPPQDVNVSSVLLPEHDDATNEYVIISKSDTMSHNASIARFLEMTTFGTKKSEIVALSSGSWDDVARANYVHNQMDIDATSHREYWRRRTNSIWDATSNVARSDHPCSPKSKWRRYAFLREDRYNRKSETEIVSSFETVPAEKDLVTTLYEADSDNDVSYNSGTFEDQASSGRKGYSGLGFYDFAGTGDYLEFTVNMAEAGTFPISFRYALGSSSYSGRRPLELAVNGVQVVASYEFVFTDNWSYWKYSELVDVSLNAGFNSIRITAVEQNGGPNVDHLRIGKPPAVVIKSNGWPRAIAKNGLHCLDDWPCDFSDGTEVVFKSYPDASQGDLYRYAFGRLRVLMPTGKTRYLDIGNPSVDFNGYEDYLPSTVFLFDETHAFENTTTDLQTYPLVKSKELLLTNGFIGNACNSVPPFTEEGDAPVFGKLPDGSWLQYSPSIMLEDNGPLINDDGDQTSNVLIDGGGETFVLTKEKTKCANVQRSFTNEDTCFLSTSSMTCSASQPIGEIPIVLDANTIKVFYNESEKYVYAVRGLVMDMEDSAESPCVKKKSRWIREANKNCPNPTTLQTDTIAALQNALGNFDIIANEYVADVSRSLVCNETDQQLIEVQLDLGGDCYTHVHPNEMNIYDFSGWVTKHPGGEYNIQKWATGFEGHEVPPNGWFLTFPFYGVPERGVPQHPMSRWETKAVAPNIVYVAKFGDTIAFRDLPNDLKTEAVAEEFGAAPELLPGGGGVMVCGSKGEVSNDPMLTQQNEVRSNRHYTTPDDQMNNQKSVIWAEIALYGQDQLRQRMAWALAQIVTNVPVNINADTKTEPYLIYYDIFVRNAFGNYRDILKETAFSPLMAEHLSYIQSKSHSYVYEDEDKRISRADENYAREVMQLFTIGLNVLNDDGQAVTDPNGNPLQTYTNEDIESYARGWTGFNRVQSRSNYEDQRTGSADNRVDPMNIIPEWRDPFPKTNLDGGFIGDTYPLCVDLPERPFLKKGATYRLLGGKPTPELMKDPSYFDKEENDILRLAPNVNSDLYQKLYNNGNYKLTVELDADLTCDLNDPVAVECKVDTARVVQVGAIYYEYVERPCVQLAFYENGKQIMLRSNTKRGTMCANADLAHAREACCRQEVRNDVNTAKMARDVSYFYDGERMKYDTAHARCVNYGKDLCVYESITAEPNNNNNLKNGYHWTNKDCGINVKVNQDGYIAIVHDAMSTYKDTIPWLVEEESTLNWFRVWWNGDYPGSSESNSCASNNGKLMDDGSCVLRTSVSESVVYNDLVGLSKEDVMSQLFLGSVVGIPEGSTSTDLGNDLKAHILDGKVDATTVFEVLDKGRTIYLKNVLSTVSVEGWEMVPQIFEAEDAMVKNATVQNSASATGGQYVYLEDQDHGAVDDTSSIEWIVDVPTTGTYLISVRYAIDTWSRWMDISVNEEKVVGEATSTQANINNIDSEPETNFPELLPLQRCQGDCDNDSHCADGLFCLQRTTATQSVPGCLGEPDSDWDYCMGSIPDIRAEYGLVFTPTGGWNQDWHYTDQLQVNLIAGSNTIRAQIPNGYKSAANIDHLKVEGVPSATLSSFRNAPHFMGLIPNDDSYSEMNARDAHFETDAILDSYFHHDNTAPFLCVRFMQRFSFSNPSPSYARNCVNAFRTGTYISSSGSVFGDGQYGNLNATLASIVLDKEATESAIQQDPSFGSVKEPMLTITHLMRSMEYQTHIPRLDSLDGQGMQETYNVKLWNIDQKIGHGPYNFPTVFSWLLPEYIPTSGTAAVAQLTSPETMVATMPNIINRLNGMFSMIKYGLSDCKNGFGKYPGYGSCSDNGQYKRSVGHLHYIPPKSDNDMARAKDLSLLLTSDRLSTDELTLLVDSCATEPDDAAKSRCMQQLIVTTSAFQTTSTATLSGEDRVATAEASDSNEEYKAIIYLYLGGGCDSYNMLAPYNCVLDEIDEATGLPVDVYQRYRKIRGQTNLAEGVGLPLGKMLEIPANNTDQPCQSFGIHEELPALKSMYDAGELIFVTNAGLMAKPVTKADYRGETPVQLFAHNSMNAGTKAEDINQEYAGTGVGGRMIDVLVEQGIPSNTFSIDGQQVLLTGEAGTDVPPQYVVSSSGLSSFNSNPSISNMNDVIKALNSEFDTTSGFFADIWSSKLTESLNQQDFLKVEIDNAIVKNEFPSTGTAEELEMVTRIMQTREARGSKRDIFYLSDGGHDTHSNVNLNQINNFNRINGAIDAFVQEVKDLGLWHNTILVQFSEFARTLNPNTGDGSDHGWGGNHFMFGGGVKGGKVLGTFPIDFEQGDADGLALSRGRMIPTTPWDAMWLGVAQWFGVPDSVAMEKVLPMHKNFPNETLFDKTKLFAGHTEQWGN